MRRRPALLLLAALAATATAACEPVSPPLTDPTTPTATVEVGNAAYVAADGVDQLQVDDHPKPADRDKTRVPSETYNRDRDWQPHGWTDPDGNGCDSREDTLTRDSVIAVTQARGCRVTGGRWPKVYVAGFADRPIDIDIDHVVALADAWRSGGWRWFNEREGTTRMQAFAQDPEVLWAVDRTANRAKGDKTPDLWRPNNQGAWCVYATRYTHIKAKYQLTVTSAERDALGVMLGTCTKDKKWPMMR